VLDEPTNDLDIETLELLEELVSEFEGTVLLVSHDRVFVDRVVTSTLAIEGDGRVEEYIGGYNDYLRQRPERLPAEARGSSSAPKPKRAKAGPRKLSYNERREFDALPGRISALEEEQQRLKDESVSAEFYKSPAGHIHEVLGRIDAVQSELDAALGRWLELDSIEK